jgi:hypothetical protein
MKLLIAATVLLTVVKETSSFSLLASTKCCSIGSTALKATSSSSHYESFNDIRTTRRSILASVSLFGTIMASSSPLGPSAASAAATDSSVDYKAVASDIAALVKQDPDKGPTLVCISSS